MSFRKPNKKLGLPLTLFGANAKPNSKQDPSAVYKRLRENGAD